MRCRNFSGKWWRRRSTARTFTSTTSVRWTSCHNYMLLHFTIICQELTGNPIVLTGRHREMSCQSCGKGLQGRGGKMHYEYRNKCVGEHLIRAFGYSPFIGQPLAQVPVKALWIQLSKIAGCEKSVCSATLKFEKYNFLLRSSSDSELWLIKYKSMWLLDYCFKMAVDYLMTIHRIAWILSNKFDKHGTTFNSPKTLPPFECALRISWIPTVCPRRRLYLSSSSSHPRTNPRNP